MGAGNVRSFELATGAGWMGAVRAKSLQSEEKDTPDKERKIERLKESLTYIFNLTGSTTVVISTSTVNC